MVALSLSVNVFACATGIADAENVGVNAKAPAANPIAKIRFIEVPPEPIPA
jgi:hypothetical protein